MNLTEHFTLEELVHSDTALRLGINQEPPYPVLVNLRAAAAQMELVRDLLGGHPIRVSSGYRAPDLNKAIGGAAFSAHLTGYAVDFTCPEFGTPQEIVKHLSTAPGIAFDQLIFEGTWVHISFIPTSRRQVLTAHFSGGSVTYTEGVV